MNLKLTYGHKLLLSQFPDSEAVNVRKVLGSFKISHPEVYARCSDADGNIRETLTIFVNGDHIRYREGLETALQDGDEIYIVPLITGG